MNAPMKRLFAFLNSARQSSLPLDILSTLQCFMPVIMLGLAAWYFREFVLRAIHGNTILNMGILAVATFGAILIAFRLFEAQRERLVLRRFYRMSTSGADMKELLQESWLARRMMYRYLAPIAETGGKLSSALDQEAIEGELRALSTEFESRLEFPGFLVGFMVSMGLLGTFIGLLETLTGISGMLDGMSGGGNLEDEFVKLIDGLRTPLAGMGIAFSASMFGLVTSLMLGVMHLTVRRYVRRVISDARFVLNALVTRVRQPSAATGPAGGMSVRPSSSGGVSEAFLSDFVRELISNMDSLQELFHRSQDSTMQMGSRIDTLAKRLEMVSQSIESNIAANKKTNDLLGFGPRMKETNEQMLSELNAIVTANTSLTKVNSRMVDVLGAIDQKLTIGNDTQRSFQDSHANLSTDTLGKLDEAVGLLHNVNDRGSETDSRLDRRLQALTTSSNSVTTGIQQLSTKIAEVSSVSQNQLNAMTTSQQAFRDAVAETLDSFKELGAQMKKVEDVNVGTARHLWDIKENVGGMGSVMEPLEQIASGVTRQGSVLEATLEEMRSSQRNLTREMQKEFREVSRDLARVLEQQQHHMLQELYAMTNGNTVNEQEEFETEQAPAQSPEQNDQGFY